MFEERKDNSEDSLSIQINDVLLVITHVCNELNPICLLRQRDLLLTCHEESHEIFYSCSMLEEKVAYFALDAGGSFRKELNHSGSKVGVLGD